VAAGRADGLVRLGDRDDLRVVEVVVRRGVQIADATAADESDPNHGPSRVATPTRLLRTILAKRAFATLVALWSGRVGDHAGRSPPGADQEGELDLLG